jgi:hypothetical protein
LGRSVLLSTRETLQNTIADVFLAPGDHLTCTFKNVRSVPGEETPTPTPTPTPTCLVTLTLESIEVLDDTEIGQEEWLIETRSNFPAAFRPLNVEADIGEGVVVIDRIVGSKTYPKAMFPVDHAVLGIEVRELDGGNDEKGRATGFGPQITCPTPASGVHFSQTVLGQGLDGLPPFGLPEFFEVRLVYRWDVVEQ